MIFKGKFHKVASKSLISMRTIKNRSDKSIHYDATKFFVRYIYIWYTNKDLGPNRDFFQYLSEIKQFMHWPIHNYIFACISIRMSPGPRSVFLLWILAGPVLPRLRICALSMWDCHGALNVFLLRCPRVFSLCTALEVFSSSRNASVSFWHLSPPVSPLLHSAVFLVAAWIHPRTLLWRPVSRCYDPGQVLLQDLVRVA